VDRREAEPTTALSGDEELRLARLGEPATELTPIALEHHKRGRYCRTGAGTCLRSEQTGDLWVAEIAVRVDRLSRDDKARPGLGAWVCNTWQ
jgi:hypothetical protein